MNFNSDDIKDYDDIVNKVIGMSSYSYALKKLDLDLKNSPTLPTESSIEKP